MGVVSRAADENIERIPVGSAKLPRAARSSGLARSRAATTIVQCVVGNRDEEWVFDIACLLVSTVVDLTCCTLYEADTWSIPVFNFDGITALDVVEGRLECGQIHHRKGSRRIHAGY